MIRGKYLSINDDLTDVLNIRSAVLGFKDRPISPLAMNVLIYEEQSPVATGSIIYDGDSFFIEAIAVLERHRNKGFGEFALRLLADKALLSGAEEIHLKCDKKVSGFFEKYKFVIHKESDDGCVMNLRLEDFKPPCGGGCSK